MKHRKAMINLLALSLAAAALCSCSRLNGTYYAENGTFSDVDLAATLDITFSNVAYMGAQNPNAILPGGVVEPNFPEDQSRAFPVRVYGQMMIYSTPDDRLPTKFLSDGDTVQLVDVGLGDCMKVLTTSGTEVGYAKDGFMSAIAPECEMYAELPIEYGKAKTNAGDYVDAYSHLVDIRRYFRCYESTQSSNEGVDLSGYDLKISMKLSTSDTSIGRPFYDSNLCMLQYDILPMLKQAMDIFAEDGYKIVIYDAYRPTSVQQEWFNVVRVHKWVADPSIGMGGIHDRGTAIDMSLIDANGNELEMPTPMHTFSEDSARDSSKMSDEARKNMNYMTNVMVRCGFTYINSEWWHFQDVNTQNYLPTDHPIDLIPRVSSEK